MDEFELREDWAQVRDDVLSRLFAPPERVVLATAIEDIPAGETIVIDLTLGLAARPFDADR